MATMRAAREAAEEALAEAESDVRMASKVAAKRGIAHSKAEFARLGLLVKNEPNMARLVDRWVKDNVARITGMTDDQLGKIERILRDGDGMRAETLAKEISRQVEDVSDSRAEFIARDQVLTLNAQVTHERMGAAGITTAIWSTSGDERVRDSHADMDGEEFDLDDPPIVDGEPTLPGEAPMCRCVSFPVLPELDD